MAGPASVAASTTSGLALPTSSSPAPSSPTTSASPTSSSTSPTSTTNAATSTQSTSASATTTSSGTTSALSSSAPTSLTPTTAQIVTTSGGSVVTLTSTVVSTVTPTAQNASTSSNSFFSNTGAVAGVFTVVGLIVFALIIALIVNAVRRRRAEKFDRDVAEAAAEAAASSHSPFDDYSYPNTGNGGGGGGGGGGGYGYSDNSHGTYQLPPLAPPPTDPYGMSEMSQYDPYAAGAASLAASAVGRSRSRKDSEPGAPGIAGVGAGALGREPSKRAPYHAFAGPGPQPHELQGSSGTLRGRRDVLEAAGLAASMPSTTSPPPGNNGGAYITRKPSDTAPFNGGRSQLGSMSSGGHHPPTLQPGYPVESYYPQRNDSLSPDPFAAGYPTITTTKALPNPHDVATGSLPSIGGDHAHALDDEVDSGSPTALRSDEQRMSYQDDTDYSQGHRVLRVANE